MAQETSFISINLGEGIRNEEKVLTEREFNSASYFSSTHKFLLSTSFAPNIALGTMRIKKLCIIVPAL